LRLVLATPLAFSQVGGKARPFTHEVTSCAA
jgi:hypothetical protein